MAAIFAQGEKSPELIEAPARGAWFYPITVNTTLMAIKKALPCPTTMDRSEVFSELILFAGQIDADPDGNIRHPNDPVGQTQGVALARPGFFVEFEFMAAR